MRYRRAWFFVAAAMIIGFSSSALLAAQASVWKGKITKDGDITAEIAEIHRTLLVSSAISAVINFWEFSGVSIFSIFSCSSA